MWLWLPLQVLREGRAWVSFLQSEPCGCPPQAPRCGPLLTGPVFPPLSRDGARSVTQPSSVCVCAFVRTSGSPVSLRLLSAARFRDRMGRTHQPVCLRPLPLVGGGSARSLSGGAVLTGQTGRTPGCRARPSSAPAWHAADFPSPAGDVPPTRGAPQGRVLWKLWLWAGLKRGRRAQDSGPGGPAPCGEGRCSAWGCGTPGVPVGDGYGESVLSCVNGARASEMT